MLRAQADELGVDLTAAHVWDFSAVSLSLGGAGGVSWLRQRFETLGRAPGRDSMGLSIGALLGVSSDLPRDYQLFAETHGQVLFFEQRRSNGSDAAVAKPALRLTLGAGKHF